MSKYGNLVSDTDLNAVTVITKHGPATTKLKTQSALNAAMRSGVKLETEKKTMAGGNRQHTSNKNTLHLDNETEQLHHDRVPLGLGKTMQQARAAKEWSQKDLSTAINEKPQVVAEYENGKAVPNQQILQKMERALGVKLRGKEMGQPLAPKGSKAKK